MRLKRPAKQDILLNRLVPQIPDIGEELCLPSNFSGFVQLQRVLRTLFLWTLISCSLISLDMSSILLATVSLDSGTAPSLAAALSPIIILHMSCAAGKMSLCDSMRFTQFTDSFGHYIRCLQTLFRHSAVHWNGCLLLMEAIKLSFKIFSQFIFNASMLCFRGAFLICRASYCRLPAPRHTRHTEVSDQPWL